MGGDVTVLETPTEAGRIFTRSFMGRSLQAQTAGEPRDPQSRAALRQFSLERLTAYGVNQADAVELRGRVAAGEAWREVAADLAEACLDPPEAPAAACSRRTSANRLFRASALVRMSQMMMLRDSEERRAIVLRAAALYADAAGITGDRRKLTIPSEGGDLSGWLFPAAGEAVGCAVVIGGVEGWAMDFESLGRALVQRGVTTLLLDGPGQGESRMVHDHYLTRRWRRDYGAVFDALGAATGGAPLAFVGNSMGGAVALSLAAKDRRIRACCDNGGPPDPLQARSNASFFTKMVAHCGDVGEDAAAEIWRTVDPMPDGRTVECPLLIVHGGLDPLVSTDDATLLFERARSSDKQMVVFSDGDHCVYNHQDDKHDLISDWVASRLQRAWP